MNWLMSGSGPPRRLVSKEGVSWAREILAKPWEVLNCGEPSPISLDILVPQVIKPDLTPGFGGMLCPMPRAILLMTTVSRRHTRRHNTSSQENQDVDLGLLHGLEAWCTASF